MSFWQFHFCQFVSCFSLVFKVTDGLMGDDCCCFPLMFLYLLLYVLISLDKHTDTPLYVGIIGYLFVTHFLSCVVCIIFKGFIFLNIIM